MGQIGSKIRSQIRRWKRKSRVYLANTNTENENQFEKDHDHDNESENKENEEFVLPLAQSMRYEEKEQLSLYVKHNLRNDMVIVRNQARQAIIDATIVSSRKNKYGNEVAKTGLTPNSLILKSMLSRGTRVDHDEYIRQNEKEMLNHVAHAHLILGYRTNDFVDDHHILHQNDAYFSSTEYFLADQPVETPPKEMKRERKTSFNRSDR